jgi:hypothetical protein
MYDIAKKSYVTLKVFDILGKEIYKLENGLKETGRYSVDFDARGLSSGTYFYKIKAIERNTGKIFSEIKKMVVVK